MDGFSFLAVIVAAVAYFVLGSLWYTVLFGKPWRADMGVDPDAEPQAPAVALLAGSAVFALALALAMEFIVRDAPLGTALGGSAAIAIVVASIMAQNSAYDQRPARLGLINIGYAVVGTMLVGTVCGLI